jgi:riboflavin kinase/FMN adenylyltransferase
MELFHSLDQAAAAFETKPAPSVVTIGAFDGIHLAHRELLRLVRERAAQKGAVSVAITFDPHPLRVLAPQKAPRLLTPHPVRLELLASSGLDRLLVLPFTRDFSLWSPEKFVEEVLAKTLRAAAVIVGDNFRFGYRAAGDVDTLAELGEQWNFATEVLPTIHIRRMPVSSSQIRLLLEEGRIERANRLLGRPFSIRHTVESGLGIGRTQTVPTLNLAPYAELLPATGVYVTETRIVETRNPAGKEKNLEAPRNKETEVLNPESGIWNSQFSVPHSPLPTPHSLPPLLRSVTNVGYRPTFVERSLGVETHLLDPFDPSPDPLDPGTSGASHHSPLQAPARIEVRFLYRLRDERKFDSPEELKEQILRDIRRSQSYFRRAGKILPRSS